MARQGRTPCIYVLAGPNGAGKSSIAGATFLQSGVKYFNPDEAARRIRNANPTITQQEANSAGWQEGKRLLAHAIEHRLNFALETTLGGTTIPTLLERACAADIEVRIWYACLDSPELHVERVHLRVRKGGHDIPDLKIRDRYYLSRLNLIRLVPKLTELRVYDNSREADPDAGLVPEPLLILHMNRGKILTTCDLAAAPEWSKPILLEALKGSR